MKLPPVPRSVSRLVSLIHILRLPKGGTKSARLSSSFRFAFPFLPHFVAQWVLGAADFWILGKAGFEQELGSYSLAAQVVVPATMVVTA